MSITEFAEQLTMIPASFEEIASSDTGKAAKRDGLSVKETKNTDWWKIVLDGDEVGIIGMILVKLGTYRLKAAYIRPEWRRQGFYTLAAAWIMKMAKLADGNKLVAFVRPDSGAALRNLGWISEDPAKPNIVSFDLNQIELDDDATLLELARLWSGA